MTAGEVRGCGWLAVAAVAAGTAVAATGCVMSTGVPTWAMHVRPSPVNVAATPAQIASYVTYELSLPVLPQRHVPAEQLALLAIADIQQRRLVDAGLWLALADYRYYQQAIAAKENGLAGANNLPAGVNPTHYAKLVVAEIELYGEMGFTDELDAVNARLLGRTEVEVALQEQLMELGKTSALERESMRDAIAQLKPTTTAAAAATHFPQLAEAFRRRLLDDFARKRNPWIAPFYLSQTPIASLRRSAMFVTDGVFDPRVCSALAGAFPAERPQVIAALAHARPDVRGNAAATLGMAPSEDTRAVLEARLPIESDARVKLVLAFALVHHGATEHLTTLTGALAGCDGAGCALPTVLINWLPTESKVDLSQAPLARIVANSSADVRARRFAAATLRDIGKSKALDARSLEALIVAGRFQGKDTQLRDVAIKAVQNDDGLSRADVVARLQLRAGTHTQSPDVVLPAPLLARLANVSTAADLPLLKQMMERFGDHEGPEAHFVVDAALNIPGEAAEGYLGNWFIRYRRLQAHIAFGLATRETFPRDRLDRLAARGDARTQIIVKAVKRDPDLNAMLLAYLSRGNVDQKFQASSVAWFVGASGMEDTLRALLMFEDPSYYPADALVRHAAMASLVRTALIASRPPASTADAKSDDDDDE